MLGFYEQPWALTQSYLLEMETALRSGRYLSASPARQEPQGRVTGNSITIPIMGPIFHRPNFFTRYFGGTDLQSFTKAFRGAVADPDYSTIMLDVDSPGGTVDGVAEAAATIFAARRAGKRIIAVANTTMASAAYWIASAAGQIVATPSAQVGSIGVYGLHMDVSAQLEAAGIKPTFISAGKYKTDGNELEPLTDSARGAMQKRVDEIYAMFVADVARFRGVSISAVRNGFGEGRVVGAEEAVRLGMVDRIGTLDSSGLSGLIAGPAARTAKSQAAAWARAELHVRAECGADVLAAFLSLRIKTDSLNPSAGPAYERFTLAMEREGHRRNSLAWMTVDSACGKRTMAQAASEQAQVSRDREFFKLNSV